MKFINIFKKKFCLICESKMSLFQKLELTDNIYKNICTPCLERIVYEGYLKLKTLINYEQ